MYDLEKEAPDDNRMIIWVQSNIHKFFSSQLDFRVRMFNLLAMVGAVISLLMAVTSLWSGGGELHALVNLAIAGLSFGLLYYSYATGQYQRCYLATIFVIFFIGFAFLFFQGGGYHSAMPSFFIFGTVFTVFMLEGRVMVAIATLELLFYAGLCVYAYHVPSAISWLVGEKDVMTDVVVGFVSVSVALGITMYFSFHMYNRQQRQLEQAREEAVQANQAKSMFLAKMSHEIRTPINIMLGMNEMVLRQRPSAEVANYVARSQDAGQMLLVLINDILDLSKIESGKLELLEEAYFTEGLIQELTQMGKEQAETKGLAFSADISGVPAMLWGDRLHIRQIAANFLSNAVKYTQTGSVKLSITGVELPDQEGITLSILVQDTGIGIHKEALDTVFVAFARGRAARSLEIEGTGLGLAIAKELTNLMGGRLSLQSAPGVGSTFSVDIPQRYVQYQVLALRENTVSMTEQSLLAPQGRILVVDDNEGNLKVIKSLLARTLLRVDLATGGRQCMEMALHNNYHVILLDYMMPQPDGIATLHELRRLQCTTPVVALTADVTTGTRQKLLNAGFASYLAKPVPWAKLEQTLLSFLPKHLVSLITINGDPEQSTATQALQQQLQQHGIDLEDGLPFLSQSLSQYKTVAGLFHQHTGQTGRLLSQLAAAGDLTKIFHAVHSLKSLACIIGAKDLADTARRIEQKCSQGETEYVRLAIQLLQYELELVRQGIAENLLAADSSSSDADRIPSAPAANKAVLLESAAVHIADYHCTESRQALRELLALEQDPADRQRLEEACLAVDELNFEYAEALLRQFREKQY
jgi:signal transduction histidine kinase/CheY-like chemotaxis protein